MRNLLWRTMLDADFNSRYWRKVTQKYSDRDFAVKLILALSASGTVAGWSIWDQYPLIWKLFSGFSALASIASPILAYGKKVEASASHAGLWADLRIRYADLWDTYNDTNESDSIQKEYTRLKKIFLELESKEPKLKIPEDRKLAKQCQQEVLAAKHLRKE